MHSLAFGDKFGDYTVVRLLGKGGMGAVWLLRADDGREVAAKILDPSSSGVHETRKRFLREAQLALDVKHPNLVETYDVGEDPETGLCYILMEYVPGGTLADYLKEAGALPIEDAVAVVEAMADVLEVGRQKNIVHRDIKPANIMFAADGTPKLADLGIARGSVAGVETTTVTQTGMMIGTPAYMAPEQMLDAHSVDTRADIYSLGVVFFEMLTGERPNKDDTVVQLMAKAVKGEPLPDVRTLRPEVSAALAQLLAMMVAPDKDGRISTPGQITSALGIIARGGELVDAAPSPRQKKDALDSIGLGGGSASTNGRARTPAAPQMDRKAFPWKSLVPVCILAALAAVFVVLAPKRKSPQPAMPARPSVTTSVVERVVEKRHVVTNVVYSQSGAAAAGKKAKDGKYTFETPEGEWTYHVRDGKAWLGGDDKPALYPLPEGRLALPKSLQGVPITGIAKRAFARCHDLREVIVPEGYESIGRDAFQSCESLESIVLPKSLLHIDGIVFHGTRIHTLDLNRMSEWDPRVLGGMAYLEELRFDALNRQFVQKDRMVLSKDGSRLLFVPRSTTELHVPSGVSQIDERACEKLAIRSLTVPESIREISFLAFVGCSELRKIEFANVDVSIGVKAFWCATNLVEVKFGKGLTRLSQEAFLDCSSLRELNLPDSLVALGMRTFADNVSLASVRLPSSFREMGAECFRNCRALRHVCFEGDAPELLDHGESLRGVDVFMGTPRDLVVYVKRGSKGWNPDGDGLPDRWPVGAGGNARTIRYVDSTVSGADGESADALRWMTQATVRPKSEILVGYCPRWAKPETYFEDVSSHVKVKYLQNRDFGTVDLKNVALAMMVSSDESEYGLEVRNVERCLAQGVNVVFVAHTPGDVRERFLSNYGLGFGRVPDSAAFEGVGPAFKGMTFDLDPAGVGRPLGGESSWRGLIALKEADPPGYALAVRPAGRGRLFFMSGRRRVTKDGVDKDRHWWNVVLRSCGIAVKTFPDGNRTSPSRPAIDPDALKDPDPTRAVQKALDALFPGWKTSKVGDSGSLGYWRERDGETDIICTHPPRRGEPTVLSKMLTVEGKAPVLHVRIANNEEGSQFRLRVRVDGKIAREKDIVAGWTDVYVDLRRWKGKKARLALEHLPTGWMREWAFWSAIEIDDDMKLLELAAQQEKEQAVAILDRKKVVGSNPLKAAQRTCDVLFPGWKISDCGHPDEAGYEEEHKGRYNLLFTHPPCEGMPAVLSRLMVLPRKDPTLFVSVIGGEDFELQVKVDGKIIHRADVTGREWSDLSVDLAPWAGKNVMLELLNMPSGWLHEEAHWQRIEVK